VGQFAVIRPGLRWVMAGGFAVKRSIPILPESTGVSSPWEFEKAGAGSAELGVCTGLGSYPKGITFQKPKIPTVKFIQQQGQNKCIHQKSALENRLRVATIIYFFFSYGMNSVPQPHNADK
jgi:hypothetical protein